jgi:ribonuclease VapC
MVIDASVLIAILLDEPERSAFAEAIRRDELRLVSAMTKLEVSMVMIARYDLEGAERVDRLLKTINATIVPFDEHQADIARDAFARFGKGRHRAGLNFGDCASYALAMAEAEPLFLKGTQLGVTEVVGAKGSPM